MKYVAVIIFLVIGFAAKSQQRFPSGFPTQSNQGWTKWGYLMGDSAIVVANRDTNWLAKYSGTIVFKPSNKKFYWFDSTNLTWNLLNSSIDTTSLSNRINLKLNISDTVGAWLSQSSRLVDTMYRVNDSTVGYTIKGAARTFQILGRSTGGGGGSGTVTSVALSMPYVFGISGSPITTNGTLNVTMPGSSSSYVRANGTAATTDTGMIPNFHLKVRSLFSGSSPITYNSTTGVIGIANANTSGTKGAATFSNSDFGDNGSGLISLSTLVSNGSCTNCTVTFGADGRATAYANGVGPTAGAVDTIYRIPGVDSIYYTINSVVRAVKDSVGAGGSFSNNNVGGGFRWVKTPAGNIATAFGSNTVIIDSSSNSNGLTFKADTSLLATQFDISTKLNSSDTTNKWINNTRRTPGSTNVEIFKNGSWTTAYTDSVGTGSGGPDVAINIFKDTSFVVLLGIGGESNAGGDASDACATSGEKDADPNVQIMQPNSSFAALNIGAGNNLAASGTHGVELEIQNLIPTYFNNRRIYLVKAGVFGSTIGQWQFGTANYDTLITRMDNAIAAIHAMGKTPAIGLIWMQGINDGVAPTPANVWAQQTLAFFADFRRKYGYVPIIMSQLIGDRVTHPTLDTLDQKIEGFAADKSLYFYRVPTPQSPIGGTCADSIKTGGIHWEYLGMKAISERMINTMMDTAGLYPYYYGIQNITNNAWNINGNRGIDSASNFLGTLELAPFSIKTNSISALFIGSDQRVGIGTTSPTKRLDVNGDAIINSHTVGRGGGNIISNVVLGSNALVNNTTGTNNIAIGYTAMGGSTANFNIAIGTQALSNMAANCCNVALGFQAGVLSTGPGNVFIGTQAGSIADYSNKFFLSNFSNSNLLYGDFSTKALVVNPGSPAIDNGVGTLQVKGKITVDTHTIGSNSDSAIIWDRSTNEYKYAKINAGSGGITTINTLTASTQTFAIGTSGSDFNINSTTSTHTFNLPDASSSNRGAVTINSQTFGGLKTFNDGATITNPSASQATALIINGNRSVAAAPGIAGIGFQVAAFTYTNTAAAGTETQGQNFNVITAPALTSPNAISYTGTVTTLLVSAAPVATGSTTISHPYTIVANEVSRFGEIALGLAEQAGDQTISATNAGINIYTGSGGNTWTLPALVTHPGKIIMIKNAGGGNLTVQRGGSDNIYDTSSVTSITIAAGAARMFTAGSSFWYVH